MDPTYLFLRRLFEKCSCPKSPRLTLSCKLLVLHKKINHYSTSLTYLTQIVKTLTYMVALTLEELNIWHDSTSRSGAFNMAIDQLLLEQTADLPLLRFYSWNEPTISFGYFDSLTIARKTFNDKNLNFIRRWTGGGIVDHRTDLTYTIIIPSTHEWSRLKGAESYRFIHQAIALALQETGTHCQLTTEDTGDGSSTCFTNPVTHDIISPAGKKLAGAGQKRTRHGLLHQGSIIGIANTSQWQKHFTKKLSKSTTPWFPENSLISAANDLATSRYLSQEWINKRP